MTNSVHVILPAFNEEQPLPNLLQRFSDLGRKNPELGLKVYVINDGSSDGTANTALQDYAGLNVQLHNHERNMGLGQAVLTGLQQAVAQVQDNDVLVVMDADDTHDVNLIPEMTRQLHDGADIVIASRFVPGGDDSTAPAFRRVLSRGASIVFKILFPVANIRDFTSGYRGYRANLIGKAIDHWGERLVEEDGFACMVELLLKLRHWDPQINEIGMHLRYDRKLSASKLKLFRTVGQYLILAIRNRLTPAPRII